jgi:hypothetical protein
MRGESFRGKLIKDNGEVVDEGALGGASSSQTVSLAAYDVIFEFGWKEAGAMGIVG